MIKGHVDDNLQARVPAALLDKAERRFTLSTIVDTGFSGDLCVSIAEIEKLDLTFSHSQKFELGVGRWEYCGKGCFLGADYFRR